MDPIQDMKEEIKKDMETLKNNQSEKKFYISNKFCNQKFGEQSRAS
jgi:hypothetical protein